MNKIKVAVINDQKIVKPNIKRIKQITEFILREEGCRQTQVTILLTNDNKIKKLNKKFRKVNKATDVLAFCQQNSKTKALRSNLLGDVVISAETAKRQAKRYNQTVLKELYLYLIHGLLHLLNYKDENPKDCQIIETKQEEFLDKIWKEER